MHFGASATPHKVIGGKVAARIGGGIVEERGLAEGQIETMA